MCGMLRSILTRANERTAKPNGGELTDLRTLFAPVLRASLPAALAYMNTIAASKKEGQAIARVPIGGLASGERTAGARSVLVVLATVADAIVFHFAREKTEWYH